MSLGTITVTARESKRASTPVFFDVLSFPGDGSYPTGGTATFQTLVRAALGDSRTVEAVIDIGGASGYYPVYDRANDKLMTFVRTTGVETANAVNLGAVTFKVLVIST